jgi:glycosyltransferase involved in cell wall biosynthesis
VKDGKVVIARLWSRYNGKPFVRSNVIFDLDPERFQTILIYMRKSSKKLNPFEAKGYKAFYLSQKKYFRIFNISAVRKLAKILKDENVDIIQCQKHQSTVYGTVAARLAGTPVVLAHVEGLDRTRNIRRKLVNRFVLKRINRVLTVAECVKDDVLKNNSFLSAERIFTLGNSTDYNRFAGVSISKEEIRRREKLPVSSFLFGTIGRLAPTKGQSYLIRAFSIVKQQIPSAQLVFVGSGRLKDRLENEARKASCHDSIRFLGRREDIPELLRGIDCFVLPSVAEGLPSVILEAMSAGVPCIATKVGGIPEVITDKETGFLVPPGDVNTLAERMIAVAKEPQQQMEDIINKAKQLVQTSYTHDVIRRKLEHLYETELRSSVNVNP